MVHEKLISVKNAIYNSPNGLQFSEIKKKTGYTRATLFLLLRSLKKLDVITVRKFHTVSFYVPKEK